MTTHTLHNIKKHTFIYILPLIFFWISFLFISIASAQPPHTPIINQRNGDSLLINPGFENPYIPIEEGSSRVVANGWTAWHIPQEPNMESLRNLQPEYSEAYPDTSRIRSGENAQVISTFFGTHDGGIYQQITGLEIWSEIRFSIYAYAWSNDTNDEQSRQISTNPGGITIQVGVDPIGGIDPKSTNIIWSEPIEQYDAYRVYGVQAIAYTETITVWVRTTIESPQAYNFIYLDDAFLDTGGSTTTSDGTNTSIPFPTIIANTPIPFPTLIANTPMPEPTNTHEGIAYTSIPLNTSQPTITGTSTPTETPTPTITPTFSMTAPNVLPQATATPNIPENVAMLPAETTNVQVINESGEVIGAGVVRVYHADSVSPQNTTRVELELRFIEKFITATPFSDLTRVPVTPVTSTPQPMRPTATPRIPKHEETGIQIQQVMGASLLCLPDSFSGCDETPDPTQYVVISEGGAFWSWTLRPQATIGVHDLQLELWTLVTVNNTTRTNTLWQYPFTMIIGDTPTTADTSSDTLRSILIVLVGAIGIIAMVTVFYIQRRTSKPPAKKSSNGKKPTVFLSYRRKVSWAVALKLHESLTQMGADVFMDMEDLGEGQFAQKLMQEIQSRDYFVLLLAPDTLSSEWVMREAEFAMKSGKRIIPVLTDGFQLLEENLPTNLKNIGSHNAVTLTLEFYNAGIERIGKFIGLKD